MREEFGRRYRAAQQEALDGVTAGLPDSVEGVTVFDSLGDYRKVQSVCQFDSGGDNHRARRVTCDLADEAAIDLQLLYWQVLDV